MKMGILLKVVVVIHQIVKLAEAPLVMEVVKMNVNIKRVHKNAVIPTYATDGSGCFDFYAIDSGEVGVLDHIFDTGIQMEIPKGYSLFVFSRSGHGFVNKIRLSNCVGVIDSDYRGNIKLNLISDRGVKHFKKGDRIAQGCIMPTPQTTFTEVSELSDTERGQGGFGSTN